VSDTPISDSTPHNVADLGMRCRQLERQLNAANERIKRLEGAGDELMYDNDDMANINRWHKAKEAKP
jgi:TolA-binding protein